MKRTFLPLIFVGIFLIGGNSQLAAADRVTVIQQPLLNQPALVLPKNSFEIRCAAESTTTGWNAALETQWNSVSLTLSAEFDTSSNLWNLTATVPTGAPFELYNLIVSSGTGIHDTAANAVRVLQKYRQGYYFLHLPDTHLPTCAWMGEYDDANTVTELRTLLEEFSIINPEFVLQTGDLVDDGQSETGYQIAQELLTQATVPIFITGGNHDLWYDGHDYWHQYFGKTMDFSFNYGNHHYAGLEMYDIPTVTFTAEQMTWLKQDLIQSQNRNDLLRVLFYHYDESNQINDALVDDYELDLILYGHTHLNSENSIGTRGALELNTSFTMNNNGEYRLIKISDNSITEYPVLKYKNLIVDYLPVNDGTNWQVQAKITNHTAARFENGLVKFFVPTAFAEYNIEGGTLVQTIQSSPISVYYVAVDILPNSERTVSISSQNPPANHPPIITAATLPPDTTLAASDQITCDLTVDEPDGDQLTYVWQINGAVVPQLTTSRFAYQTAASDVDDFTISVEVSDGTYHDVQHWQIHLEKFTGIPEVQGMHNFFAHDQPGTLEWTEPTPMLARLEYSTIPGDYSEGAITETGETEIVFTPQAQGMSLGRYYCRITNGTLASREFTIIIESSIAPEMVAPIGTITYLTPVFSWERVVGVSHYMLFVSDEEIVLGEDEFGEFTLEGASPIWMILTAENNVPYGTPDESGNFISAAPPLTAGGTYWWVVLNCYGPYPELASNVQAGIAQFMVNVEPPALAAPQLISPADEANLSEDVIRFEWEPVEDAVNYHFYPYRIEIAEGIETARQYWENVITTSNNFLEYSAKRQLVRGPHRWRVAAVDADGQEVHSEYRDFFFDVPAAMINIHTFDNLGTGTPSDDELLPRTKVSYESIDGVFTGMTLSTDLHANHNLVLMSPGTYIFDVSHEGYETLLDTLSFAADDTVEVNFRLTRNSAIVQGSVVDQNSAVVADARVTFTHSLHQDKIRETASDLNGHFWLQLLPGAWRCVVTKPGFQSSAVFSISVSGDEVLNLSEPVQITQLSSTVSGTVTNPNSETIFGAEVRIFNETTEQVTPTDANGQFQFTVQAGDWKLSVSKAGFIPPTVKNITVAAGEDKIIEPGPVLIPAASILSGTVTDHARVIVDATVKAFSQTGGVFTTETDAYGHFLFNLQAGNYRVLALKTGFSTENEVQVNLATGETVDGVQIYLAENKSVIRGKATIDGTTPLETVSVNCGRQTIQTQSNGFYEMGVEPGEIQISVSKEGYFSPAPKTVTIGTGQIIENLDFILPPNASVIKGVVRSQSGAVSEAEIAATTEQDTVRTNSSEDGSYTLNLVPAKWNIQAAKSEFRPARRDSVAVGAGQTLTGVNFHLTPNIAYIVGTVQETASENPLYAATISILENGLSTQSKTDGSFQLTVEPGKYTITAEKNGYRQQTVLSPELAVEEQASVNFALTPFTCQVKGKIVDEQASPVQAVAVQITQGTQISTTATDRQGEYVLDTNHGNIAITAEKTGYLNNTGTVKISITVGELKSGIDFILRRNFAGLKGTVQDSATDNPVSGVTFQLKNSESAGGTVFSNNEGYFEFISESGELFLEEGFYQLSVSHQGCRKKTSDSLKLIGGKVTELTLTLQSNTGQVTGFVQVNDAPVEGASVSLTHQETAEKFTNLTNQEGFFSFQAIPRANYWVNAYKVGYSSPEKSRVSTNGAEISIELVKNSGSIAGRISDDVSGLALANVSIKAEDGQGHVGNTQTNVDGVFELRQLSAAYPYRLTASKYGYYSDEIENISATDSTEIELTLTKIWGEIIGQIIGTDSTGLAGVQLKLKNDAQELVDSTDSQGTYEFSHLTVGTYYLTPQAIGMLNEPRYKTVSINSSTQNFRLDFVLEKAVAHALTILGPQRIDNQQTARFSYIAKTADNRETTIQPVWQVDYAGAVEALSPGGKLAPEEQYIGPVTLRLSDSYSGVEAQHALQIYQKIGPHSPAVQLQSMDGTQIECAAGCVKTEIQLSHAVPQIANNRRIKSGFQIKGDVHDFRPIGIRFEKPVRISLPVPPETESAQNTMACWNAKKLEWESLSAIQTGTNLLTTEISELGRYAVLTESEPLSIQNIRFEPNPFSPKIARLVIRYFLTSNVSATPFVSISIFNMVGDRVKRLVSNQPLAKGEQITFWNGKTDHNTDALNGRYLVQFKVKDSSGEKVVLKTVVLIK